MLWCPLFRLFLSYLSTIVKSAMLFNYKVPEHFAFFIFYNFIYFMVPPILAWKRIELLAVHHWCYFVMPLLVVYLCHRLAKASIRRQHLLFAVAFSILAFSTFVLKSRSRILLLSGLPNRFFVYWLVLPLTFSICRSVFVTGQFHHFGI